LNVTVHHWISICLAPSWLPFGSLENIYFRQNHMIVTRVSQLFTINRTLICPSFISIFSTSINRKTNE